MAALDRDRRGERAAHLEQDERHIPRGGAAPLDLFADGERRGAHLVRRAHVDAVHLTMRRHRLQVDDPRRQNHRRREPGEQPYQRAEAADTSGLALGSEVGEAELFLREVARGVERQTVAGRSDDEVDRRRPMRVVQQPEENGRVSQRCGCVQRSVEEHVTGVEAAQIDTERTRVDPDHARHDG